MISKESPIGKALLDKKVGEVVVINNPRRITYKIKKITVFST
jgi:transcription elongation GreA/GreB family factor